MSLPRRPKFEFITYNDPDFIKKTKTRRSIRAHAQLVSHEDRRRANLARLKSTPASQSLSQTLEQQKTQAGRDCAQERDADIFVYSDDGSESGPTRSGYRTPAGLHGESYQRASSEMTDASDSQTESIIRSISASVNSGNPTPRLISDSLSLGSPATLLDSGRMDPFNTTAETISPKMNELLLHYFSIMMTSPSPTEREEKRWNHVCPIMSLWARSLVGPVVLPRYIQKVIVTVSLGKPIVMYGLCGVAAAHLHALKGDCPKIMEGMDKPENMLVEPLPLDYLIYRGKTMESLKRIMETKENLEDPFNLIALVCLLCMTIFFNAKDEARIHMTGLKGLLRLRGGWVGMPLEAAHISLTNAFMAAIWAGAVPPSPEFPGADLLDDMYLELAADIDPTLEVSAERILSHQDALQLDSLTVDLIQESAAVATYREKCFKYRDTISAEVIEYFTDQRLRLEHRLIERIFDSSFASTTDSKVRVVQLALLTTSQVNLMLLTPQAGPYCTLARLLKQALEATDLPYGWIAAQDVLLWILCLGVHISLHDRERPWFLKQLAIVAQNIGVCDWASMFSILGGCLYSPRIHEQLFRDVWIEVAGVMRKRHASESYLLLSGITTS